MPLDFTVWSTVTYRMHKQEERFSKDYREPLGHFKARLQRTAKRLGKRYWDRVWVNWKKRLQKCYDAKGDNFDESRLLVRCR